MDQEQIEIIEEFAADSLELLEEIEFQVLQLNKEFEEGELSKDTINSIFRTFHSIKGSAGFLMFDNIKNVAHSAENLLDLVRSEKIEFKTKYIDLFVLASDYLIRCIQNIDETYTDKGTEEEAESIKSEIALVIEESTGVISSQELETPRANIDKNIVRDIPEEEVQTEIKVEITPSMINDFVVDSKQSIKKVEQLLLKFPNIDDETMQTLFRDIHTIKGNCGFLAFGDLEKILHYMESVFLAIQEREAVNLAEVANMFLPIIDVLNETLESISNDGDGSILNLDLYLELLSDLMPKGFVKDVKEDAPHRRLGDILEEQGIITEEDTKLVLEQQNKPFGEILVDMGLVKPEVIEEALKMQKEQAVVKRPEDIPKIKNKKKKQQDIRVDILKLDALINLIGELVISHNMIAHFPSVKTKESLNKSVGQMGKLVRELQETAVTIRMIPIASVFKKMNRLVYDVSKKLRKKVQLDIVGEETEVDKTLIELITDPLVHIVRNSLDHGVETPQKRKENGKSEKGTITLTAKYEESEVWIIIKDDGAGINKEMVLKKAIENGLVEEGEVLKDKQIFKLIFEPGFSTAVEVSDISGRGVGMDVVKRNLEKIRGKIDVDSVAGKGTTITLKIPLTLAIIDGMRTRVGNTEYIVPLLSIRQFSKISEHQVTVSPNGNETIQIRNELLPVIRLHDLHHVEPKSRILTEGIFLLIESSNRTVALFVDEIVGQQQTVVKALSEYIGKVEGVSGCTILGNGDISLILDIEYLFSMRA